LKILFQEKKMKKQIGMIDFSDIRKSIISIKGQNVLIDSDVARIYGVETKRVNEAIKENLDKFPAGYILKLTDEETYSLRSEKTTLKKFGRGQHSKYNPTAFTEKGLYMLATILKSPQATAATIAIVEAFAKLRELSHTITKLAEAKEKPEQQSLMQRSGDIFSELVTADLPVSGTETTLEINFAVMKFRHTVKRGKKKGTVQGAKKSRSHNST
jgi:phage regulator Rha-like protein